MKQVKQMKQSDEKLIQSLEYIQREKIGQEATVKRSHLSPDAKQDQLKKLMFQRQSVEQLLFDLRFGVKKKVSHE